jgi:hypothetical protein
MPQGEAMTTRLVAVIPVHNEAATIGAVVVATRRYLPVIVVNDASNDGSGAIAAAVGATVLTLTKQGGKGSALRQGFEEALRCGAEAVVTLDGDGQHDPRDIPLLLAANRRWPDRLIIGGRLATPTAIPRYRLQAIQVASFWINWLGGCTVQDTQSGFRVYPAPLLRTLSLKQGGFLLESEVMIKAGRAGYGVQEIPVRTIYRVGQRTQYRPLRDGLTAAVYLGVCGLRWWPGQLRWLMPFWGISTSQEQQYKRQQTRQAALATGFLPILALAALLQPVLRGWGGDMLALLIRRFYHQQQQLCAMPLQAGVDAPTFHA